MYIYYKYIHIYTACCIYINLYISSFFTCIFLSYLPKLKRGMPLDFSADFFCIFFYKNVP